jgi:xylulokinase
MERVLAVDIGTQSTRAALLDSEGRIHDIASSPIDLYAPRPGWAEQDPEQWWLTTVANIAAIMERNPAAEIRAVGVGAQMHSLVAVDVNGESLTSRCAIWSDKRCLDQVRALLRHPDAEALCALAGNRPLPAWAGFKMAWLRANAPDVYDNAASLLVAKDFLNLRLAGERATDPTEASGSFLCDAASGQWSTELLAALGVHRGLLVRHRIRHQAGRRVYGATRRHARGGRERRHDVPAAWRRDHQPRTGGRCGGNRFDRRRRRGQRLTGQSADEPEVR